MRYVVVALILMAGCNQQLDPADDKTSKLVPGSYAVAQETKDGKALQKVMMYAHGNYFESLNLPSGVRVTIWEDPGYMAYGDNDERRSDPPDDFSSRRTVKVKVVNGQYEGTPGTLYRYQLRPAP